MSTEPQRSQPRLAYKTLCTVAGCHEPATHDDRLAPVCQTHAAAAYATLKARIFAGRQQARTVTDPAPWCGVADGEPLMTCVVERESDRAEMCITRHVRPGRRATVLQAMLHLFPRAKGYRCVWLDEEPGMV